MTTKRIGRDLANRDYIEISVTDKDHFAVTACLWDARGTHSGRVRKSHGRDLDASGCLHDDVRAVAGWLAPVVDIHLADSNGVPLHAKANGWYFYSGQAARHERRQIAAGRDYGYSPMLQICDHERTARALHIGADRLPTDITTHAEFDAFVDSLTWTYAQQAAHARSVIEAMTDGAGVESAEMIQTTGGHP